MSKRTGLIGTKIGNSSFYDNSGKSLPVTILKIDECIVSGIKTIEKNAKFLSVNCQTNSLNYGFISIIEKFSKINSFTIDKTELKVAMK